MLGIFLLLLAITGIGTKLAATRHNNANFAHLQALAFQRLLERGNLVVQCVLSIHVRNNKLGRNLLLGIAIQLQANLAQIIGVEF